MKRYDCGAGVVLEGGRVGRIVTNSMHRLEGTMPVRYEGTAVDALVYKADAEVEAAKEAFTRLKGSLVGKRVSLADDVNCKGKCKERKELCCALGQKERSGLLRDIVVLPIALSGLVRGWRADRMFVMSLYELLACRSGSGWCFPRDVSFVPDRFFQGRRPR